MMTNFEKHTKEMTYEKKIVFLKEQKEKFYNDCEENYKKLILEHYTFLKRPILVIDQRIISGNATKIIKEVRKFL